MFLKLNLAGRDPVGEVLALKSGFQAAWANSATEAATTSTDEIARAHARRDWRVDLRTIDEQVEFVAKAQ
jgi:hypothetical protein